MKPDYDSLYNLYLNLIEITLSHDVIDDLAFVKEDKLSNLLSNVSQTWFFEGHEDGKTE